MSYLVFWDLFFIFQGKCFVLSDVLLLVIDFSHLCLSYDFISPKVETKTVFFSQLFLNNVFSLFY